MDYLSFALLVSTIVFMNRARTSEEMVTENVDRRIRVIGDNTELTQDGWRIINPKEECFLLDELPPEAAFLTLQMRKGKDLHTYFDIFRRFINNNIINHLCSNMSEADMYLGSRVTYKKEHKVVTSEISSVRPKIYRINDRDAWQAIAVQVHIVGKFKRPTENQGKGSGGLDPAVRDAREYLVSATGEKCVRLEVLRKLMSRLLITEDIICSITGNFQALVLSLGQYVSGDEKLWHFTGHSGNVRLVISKPDRLGLWFYELCGKLSNGLPYMLYTRMHNSLKMSIPVSLIVGDWIHIMKSAGGLGADNRKCYLCADSYYLSADSSAVMKEAGIHFSCSVAPNRMKKHVAMVHDGKEDKTGEWNGIYNDRTEELFVYHFDTQKGVGKKYNYSIGFNRCTDRRKVKAHEGRVAGYEYYKTFFESCDRFNRALHDRYWPYKRGGRGTSGEAGEINDFMMACVLQNTYNAYMYLNDISTEDYPSFEDMCDELSLQIFQYSNNEL